MATVYTPEIAHAFDDFDNCLYHVFLGGTIDMGNSADWQQEIAAALEHCSDMVLLNPRRKSWDSSWEQRADNPVFCEQVLWELDGLECSNAAVIYLAPESKSPISLLELGLYALTNKVIVCCPEGFYRKGNVDIVCNRYGIMQVDNLALLAEEIDQRYKQWSERMSRMGN